MARIFAVIILFFGLFFIGIFSCLKINNKPVSNDKKTSMFVVEKGESLVNISKRLKESSLIRNKYSFLFYVYNLGLNNKLQSGTFRLSPSFSTQEIIIKLSKGGVNDYWLKIVEGSRLEEISSLFPSTVSFTQKDFLIQIGRASCRERV